MPWAQLQPLLFISPPPRPRPAGSHAKTAIVQLAVAKHVECKTGHKVTHHSAQAAIGTTQAADTERINLVRLSVRYCC